MPNWTKEQNDAIESEGENIIVSAGAGSGKTAVLSARVIRKLENHTSINELLILTFTNLAAGEMKLRIRDKIKERPDLKEELKKIDSSYITTFDSFSLSLVKKYHYLLNVRKNINIIDSNLLKIKINEYLDEIMEEEYIDRLDDFTRFITDFCIKDDKEIKSMILNVNKDLDLKYDKEEYLNKYVDDYYNVETINKNVNRYLLLLKSIISEINFDLTKLSNEVDISFYNKMSDIILPIINSNSYSEIKTSLIFDRLPNLPRGSSEYAKKYKDLITKNISSLRELTKYVDTNELVNTILLTKPYVSSIIRIIQKLDKKINDYKFENDLYDFVDICKMAIKLVKENDSVREEVKKSFKEIMVDEYQDTSDLQEIFINEISNNNVYVVGDVKQSIYRFRNANPNIFRAKYNSYANGISGKKIDLLKNFRSRSEVLQSINLIFNYVMDELIGGAEYTKSHQMIPGNDKYLNEGFNNYNNNMEIYSYDYDTNIGFTKDEIEAFIISNDINNKVSNHYQIFDKDLGKLRDATYSDFSILIDRSTSFDIYKKVFLYNKIPLSIYKDEAINDSPLFLVIKSIFKLINLIVEKGNSKEIEYTYLSIARSFLFEYSDNEIFSVITSSSYNETEIFIKLNKIIDNISSKTIKMILSEIIDEFNIYDKLRKIPDILNNYTKLEYLYSLSDNLNKMGYTYKDFDSYLKDVIDNEVDVKFSVIKEDGASVKIMTIHSSKGLEYPICYFPGLSKKFNERDIKSKILFSNELGIITPSCDEGMESTFYKKIFEDNYYKDDISEKIRLFYVALTRAREKLIFVMPNEEKDEEYVNDIVQDSIRMKYRSFADIINSIKSKLTGYYKNIDIVGLNLTKNYNLINSHNLFNNVNKINKKIELINYPKVNTIEKESSHFSKSSSKIFTKEEKEKMDFGTKIHYYLETLDLHNPDLSDIESPFKEKIENFLNSDLLNNIKEAKIYQEYEFIDKGDFEDKHGIIDLMLEYFDHIDIIDYKLKNILDEAYTKQLNGYKDYIETISGKKTNIYLYSIMDSKYQKL